MLIAPGGNIYVSTNYCNNAQSFCPRGTLPSGVGYEKCIEVCDQPGHAEENVIRLAGDDARGGYIMLYGHTYACDSCRKMASEAGVLIEVRSESADFGLGLARALIRYKKAFEAKTPVSTTFTVDRGAVDDELHVFRRDHLNALNAALTP